MGQGIGVAGIYVRDQSEALAKGAMPPLVLVVADCLAAFREFGGRGVEFTQEPVARVGGVDASFRDSSGNGWKLVEMR
jgi:predicted enzyme related to lactoylglutathione lyase